MFDYSYAILYTTLLFNQESYDIPLKFGDDYNRGNISQLPPKKCHLNDQYEIPTHSNLWQSGMGEDRGWNNNVD